VSRVSPTGLYEQPFVVAVTQFGKYFAKNTAEARMKPLPATVIPIRPAATSFGASAVLPPANTGRSLRHRPPANDLGAPRCGHGRRR